MWNEGEKEGRTGLVPEVSRTGHAGSVGAHVTGIEQEVYFDARIMSATKPFHDLVTWHLSPLNHYEHWLEMEIQRSVKIHLTTHPCLRIDILDGSGPFVLYVGATSREDKHFSYFMIQTVSQIIVLSR